MGIEGPPILQYLVIVTLTAAGFHGLFFHKNLLKKALSWGIFQSGIILLLLALAHRDPAGGTAFPNPLANAMALLGLAVLGGVLLALIAFCLALWNKYETLDSDEIAKEAGK